MPNLKRRIIEDQCKGYAHYSSLRNKLLSIDREHVLDKKKIGAVMGNGETVMLDEMELTITQFANTKRMAELSQTILFPSEQVAVFSQLLNRHFDVPLEYRLPFRQVMLEFTKPVLISGIQGNITALGFLLEQSEVTQELYDWSIEQIRRADSAFGFDDTPILEIDWSKTDKAIINELMVVCEDLSFEVVKWTSQNPDGLEILCNLSGEEVSTLLNLKHLAIACIGYINCENVYLHKEGEVSESVNAKRERKGKSRLEPYYVCRIRGVQYDSEGYEKGAGVKHGIRYDVRGHFRRLETGKTIWVRPHQRGLQNELYVPKTYVVAKEPHQ